MSVESVCVTSIVPPISMGSGVNVMTLLVNAQSLDFCVLDMGVVNVEIANVIKAGQVQAVTV